MDLAHPGTLARAARGKSVNDRSIQRSESKAPRVTVLMSVYNGERYLRTAIDSILSQTCTDFEFLIINDGSTDDSREIILSYRDPRICMIDNPSNIGLTKSLNRGLALARGKLIARQDADDISHVVRIEKQVAYMEAHLKTVLLGTQARNIDMHGRLVNNPLSGKATTLQGIRWQLMHSNAFVHTSVMFRREVLWGQLEGYDESFDRRQDFELWSRVARSYNVTNLPEDLVDLRKHSKSIMSNYSVEHISSFEKVVFENMCRFLESKEIPFEWARFITWQNNAHLMAPPDRPKKLLGVVNSIRSKFTEINKCAQTDPTMKRLFAVELIQLAMKLCAQSKQVSLQAYLDALRTSFRLTAAMAPRYFTLLFLGESIRNIHLRSRYGLDMNK